jgi:DNA mismatch endonuclease, patch repair protein
MARRPVREETQVPFKRNQGLVTTIERSALMGRVRQAKTAPEEAVAEWLRAHRVAYRRNVRTLPGRPDFANRRAGFAIFVHGCYWHRHPGCARTTTPTRNRNFWLDKFATNIARDAARSAELEQAGFQTVTVWECEAKKTAALDEKLGTLLRRTAIRAEPASGPATTVRKARGTRAVARASAEGAGS